MDIHELKRRSSSFLQFFFAKEKKYNQNG